LPEIVRSKSNQSVDAQVADCIGNRRAPVDAQPGRRKVAIVDRPSVEDALRAAKKLGIEVVR
jgi:hypothetical protein